VIHDITPGPLLFSDNPKVVHAIFATTLVANCFMFVFMFLAVGWIARLANVPRWLLLPAILVFCVIGSYALANRMFDVWVTLTFGIIGYAMDRAEIPLAPFVIGFVLMPVAEKNLGAGLQLSGGSYLPLLTDRLSPIFLCIAACLLVWPLVRARTAGVREKPQIE
jgi:putative tricarboxylic transport membrane protein